jgi:hypothetical protein
MRPIEGRNICSRRPREGGDPYAVSPMMRAAIVIFNGQSLCHRYRQGLWVPAFAGTTTANVAMTNANDKRH